MWTFTAVSTVVGVCGLLLSVYNFLLSRRESVRAQQTFFRRRLKGVLYEVKDQLGWAQSWLETDSDLVPPGLDVMIDRSYRELRRLGDHLIFPTAAGVEQSAEAVCDIDRKAAGLNSTPMLAAPPTTEERRSRKAASMDDVDQALIVVDAYIANLIKIEKGASRHKRLFRFAERMSRRSWHEGVTGRGVDVWRTPHRTSAPIATLEQPATLNQPDWPSAPVHHDALVH